MKIKYNFFAHLIHAIILIIIVFSWMQTPYTYGDEEFIVKWSSFAKRLILNDDKSAPHKKFIFINLAYEKELIPLEENVGNEVITDREKLANFFQILQRHPKAVKFTLCDVFLKGRSKNDSLLENSIVGNSKIVFPTHFDSNGNLLTPDLNVPYAIADYKSSRNNFFKFKIKQNDSVATIPLYMYQNLTKREKNLRDTYFINDGNVIFNSVIVDHQINRNDLLQTGKYTVINLSELMLLPESIIVNDFLSERIVIMGDFENDVHNTIWGQMPGSIILVNIFLSLLKEYHHVSWLWLIFLYSSLFIFSTVMFSDENSYSKKYNWFKHIVKSSTILGAISIISYFLFNVSVQILILVVYINVILYAKRFYTQYLSSYKTKFWPKLIVNHIIKTYL